MFDTLFGTARQDYMALEDCILKSFIHLTALAAGIMTMSTLAHNASAASITYLQDISDFTTLPLSTTNPAPTAITGTVYAPNTNNVNALGTLIGSVANQWRSPFENATSIGGGVDTGVGNGGYGISGWNYLPYSSVQANSSATYDYKHKHAEHFVGITRLL